MVKTLVLVRHGAPEAASESGADLDRRLTPSGARSLQAAMPRVMSLLGDDAEAEVWSSPAVRALETAEIVADALGVEDIEVRQSLYAQSLPAFFAELEAAQASCVVAVGHAPFVDQAAARLLGSCPSFGKGAAAAISLPEGPGGHGTLRWFVAGPETTSWEELAVVEREVASAASDLLSRAVAFLDRPEDPERLLAFRVEIRRVRSLLQFIEPWQTKKQNRRSEHVLKELQVASARLRALDILSQSAADLVESGELGTNSLLPTACAKERSLECASLLALMRKSHAKKALAKLADDLAHLTWRSKVVARGLAPEDFQAHFDAEFAKLDEDLFGMDLRDGDAVYSARRDAKEMHYVAERLGAVLGEERAQTSAYMDEIQRELGALSDAWSNRRLAEEYAKSPRFRGVRADLGVVARDQAELVSALTSGIQRMEAGERGESESARDAAAPSEASPLADDVRDAEGAPAPAAGHDEEE